MKFHARGVWLALALVWVCPTVRGQAGPTGAPPTLQVLPHQNQITFVSPNTFSHQGYATDGTNHYTFDSQAIYEWSNDVYWTSIASNTSVFDGIPWLNHLGDGDCYNGKI